jgi:hypothetical protein
VKVFAVWEPILVTDWREPGGSVLRRLPDPRAKQFWDSNHLVAAQLAKDARPPQPEPGCCTRNGILWDLVAVYPPDAVWGEAMPPAVLFDGAVVNMEADIEAAVRKLQR